MAPKGLLERLKDGEAIICAEGYQWELERRGYLQMGVYTPEVVLDHPERVVNLHEEYVHAGSDVVEAFTFFGHRERVRLVGREDELEKLNLTALKLARDVADRTHTLMAGNLSNTTIYDPDDPDSIQKCKDMFKEQVEWAVRGGADYIIAETYKELGEAKLALEAIKLYGNGLPAVVTLAPYFPDVTSDGYAFPDALRQLEELGADVVGLNCGRGPQTMLPLLREVVKVCKGPIAALPVPYRTTETDKSFQSLRDPVTGEDSYPLYVAPLTCTRAEISDFAREVRELGIRYVGLCCGNSAHCLRELAIAFGKTPPACKFAPALHHSTTVGDVEKMPPRVRKNQLHAMGRRPNKRV